MSILEVLKDQRRELETSMEKKNLVPREAENCFNPHSHLIQVVSGVRRCGKSVLIYRLLKGKEFGYVNFDDDRLLNVEPNEILTGLYQIHGQQLKILFLDEIQNLKNWELFVNRLHRADFYLYITGSNAKLLAKEMATHLTGRHLTLELFPFSFQEFLLAKNYQGDAETTPGKSLIFNYLNQYLQEGGFPEVVTGREEPSPYLRELYQKIIERDIVGRYNVTHKKTLKEIAGSIFNNPARLLSYGKIRREFGLGSDHTVKNYLSYFEEAYLILTLNKFSFKPMEIERSEKKVYAIDTGMLAVLSTQTGKETGPISENVVGLELFRQQTASPMTEIYYWKSAEQEEVDFVLRKNRKVTALIQVCTNIGKEEVKKREVRALLKAGKELRCQNLLIITAEKEGEETFNWFGNRGKVRFIPLWKWLIRKENVCR